MQVIYFTHVRRALLAEIKEWGEQKRKCVRHSTGWHRADSAIQSLRDALKTIQRLEKIEARLK